MSNNKILLVPHSMYHIYNHANGKENLFVNPNNYLYFLKRYEYFIQPIANTYAYCLMPNHLHMMVSIKSEEELQNANYQFQKDRNIATSQLKSIELNKYSSFVSKIFSNLFSSYTQAFNKQQNRSGSLFAPNFKRKLIEDEVYYAKLLFYIHNNPVKHGFVKNIADWPYSSYNSFLSNKSTKIYKSSVLNWFGSLELFKQFHNTVDNNSDIYFDF